MLYVCESIEEFFYFLYYPQLGLLTLLSGSEQRHWRQYLGDGCAVLLHISVIEAAVDEVLSLLRFQFFAADNLVHLTLLLLSQILIPFLVHFSCFGSNAIDEFLDKFLLVSEVRTRRNASADAYKYFLVLAL